MYGAGKFDRQSNSIECYIEAKTSKTFTINYKFLHKTLPATDLVVEAFVDGKGISSWFHSRDEISFCEERGTYHAENSFLGFPSGTDKISPLLFKKLNLTDDASSANASEKYLNDLGTIMLGVDRVRPRTRKDKKPLKDAALNLITVHEDQKKVFHSHQVGTASPIPNIDAEDCSVEYIDPESPFSPLFVFHYRSRAFLQAENLIPDNSPSPETKDEEIQRLKRRIAELESLDSTSKRVKTEEGGDSKTGESGCGARDNAAASGSGAWRDKGKMEVITIDSDEDDV